jgi:hypothetical protein
MTGRNWAAWCNVILGALLAIAPFAAGYYTLNDIATYEAVAVGVLIAGCALWAAVSKAAPAYLGYVVALLGAWSVAAPFVLGYHNTIEIARNADIGIGILVAAIALIGHFYVSPVVRRKVAA